jgi:protein TonB
VLRVHVAADGSATEVLLHTSSGHPRLDDSALATVRRWKFVPARLGQEAVAAWVLVPIAFTLKD